MLFSSDVVRDFGLVTKLISDQQISVLVLRLLFLSCSYSTDLNRKAVVLNVNEVTVVL